MVKNNFKISIGPTHFLVIIDLNQAITWSFPKNRNCSERHLTRKILLMIRKHIICFDSYFNQYTPLFPWINLKAGHLFYQFFYKRDE